MSRKQSRKNRSSDSASIAPTDAISAKYIPHIVEKFIAEVKLTKAGASTYYQLIKDKHEPMSKK